MICRLIGRTLLALIVLKKSVAGMARKRAIELRNERLEAEEFIKELKAL